MIARQWPFPKLYQVLGVHPEASAAEIETAYRRLSDEDQFDPERQRALGVAWAVLGDRQRRVQYDREAVGFAHNEWSEAARPLVTWSVICVTAGALLLTFGVRDVGSLILWPYVAACTPWGWRAVSRARRWLWMHGWLSWLYGLAVSPIVGMVAAPVQVIPSVVELALLCHRQLPDLTGSLRRRLWRQRL